MKKKMINIITVQDFDKLVRKTYGKIYYYQQQDGCQSRGTQYVCVPCEPDDYENDKLPEIINGSEMGVSFKSWLEKDPNAPLNPTNEELKMCPYFYNGDNKKKWCEDKSNIELFWGRNFYPHVSMILNDLHSKGLIEEGEYGINIDW